MILSGTGSRDLAAAPVEHQAAVATVTRDHLSRLNPERVIAGGAEGFDHFLALVAFDLGIPVTLAIPSPTYGEYYWENHSITDTDRSREWDDMLRNADEVFYISNWHMWGRANLIRNQWMVDQGEVFFVYKPSSRGTSDAVRRIEAAGKPHIVLEVSCGVCGDPLHYNGPAPHCENCTQELCDSCSQAEEATWD